MVLYKFVIDETACVSCGACQDVCPVTCIEFTRAEDVSLYGLFNDCPKPWMMEMPYLPIQERCIGCQTCVWECPTNAITVEPDSSKPSSLVPRPVVLKTGARETDHEYWHPLSEYTKDYLKRPVRSPWSAISDWKPMKKQRGIHQTWITMEQDT